MRNSTKDKITIVGVAIFMFAVLFMIVYSFVAVVNLFATTEINYNENLTETQQYNKFMTEENIKNEMYFLSAWDTIENMSDEEYYETFLRG